MTRTLLYSHDTYGLGHLRRSTLLATAIVANDPSAEALIVTGSPLTQSFALPDRVDTLKLPSATKDSGGRYQPRTLGGTIDGLVSLRSSLLMAAVATYRPDVVLVDHAPTGMAAELIPVLERFAGTPTGPRFVLGLREIIDEAGRVDEEWTRSGTWNWLDHYDDIVVYGDRRLLTTVDELDLTGRVRATVTHTGYVAPAIVGSPTDGYLLVTPGGGGDGQALLRRYLDAVDSGATDGLRSIVVTGPLMSQGRRSELLARAQSTPSVELIEFTDSMRQLIASATGVISMAGYNTVVEELAAGVPALLVPRCVPRLEQDIRARRLAPVSRLDHCPIDRLGPARIDQFARRATGSQSATLGLELDLDLDGARRTAELIATTPIPTPALEFAHVPAG